MSMSSPSRRPQRHRSRSLVAVALGSGVAMVVASAVLPSPGALAATTTRGAGATASPTASSVRRPSPPIPVRSTSTTTTVRAPRVTTSTRPATTSLVSTSTTAAARRATSTTRRPVTAGPVGATTTAKGATTTRRGGTGTSTSTGPTSSTSSTSTTLPPDLKAEIELAIVDGQRAAAPGLKVGRATCPASLKVLRSQAKAGTYECSVVIEGVTAPYTVVVSRSDKARTGTYALSPTKAIIDVSRVIAGIREDLDPSERATAKVSCGRAKVIVAAPGSQISCTTTTGTLTMPVRYTVRDLEGTISLVTD